ncbi:ROS/MUCR transcriptional regulator [Marinicauda pacifica]|jgi:predicted transcriptional regulator|uniref:Transcriptional regulator n=1 Tax=Marinicauda pacifica TaxID=1133559 RepID=A0A4S2HET0_9PROT|nr:MULTISPECIES: MucR family transcriptional regulator [Marinicauda]TGY94580.1 transcriptional regulator [Marinicauda pacifica]GGE37053.1 ROS/MUCR transcriptional regulator [Marinicauda pacifica]
MTEDLANSVDQEEILRMTTDIVASFLTHNSIPSENVPELIKSIYGTMRSLSEKEEEKVETKQKPAVPVSKSVQDDYIVCLEDGKKLKMLKRYLRSQYDMSPEEYRRKWGLPADYPMVAPAYSRRRSQFAKDIGLGRGAAKKRGK